MDYYRRDDPFTTVDLDLNLEPLDLGANSILELGFPWIEEESPRDRVEERIRQLEAVSAQAGRQRQRLPQAQNPPQPSNASVGSIVDSSEEGLGIFERAKGVKRDSSHLVAKALELDVEVKMAVGDGEGFFDCNICLDTACDPVLTCCGHLFCWPCFYRLPHVYSTAKECPVCKGEVTDSNVTPIYGAGKGANESDLGFGRKIPPKPKANRVERVRQRQITSRMSHIPVADVLHRIRVGLGGATSARAPQQDATSAGSWRNQSHMLPGAQERPFNEVVEAIALGSQRIRTWHAGTSLEARAPSPPSILRLVNGGESFTGSDDSAQPQNRDTGSPEPTNLGSDLDLLFDNSIPRTPAEVRVNEPQPSSSSRRRNRVSRVSDADNGESQEHRRRRLG